MTTNLLDAIIAQAKLSKKETAKQQRIVQSAIALFAEKGYANTSTSEIAKTSGVAEATIFRHYGTKENLLLSVIVPFLKQFNPMLTQEVMTAIRPEEHQSFADFLHALLRNRMHFIQENREIFQIVVKELLYREELRKDLLAHIQFEPVFAHLNRALDQYKARGELLDWPNAVLLRMLATCIGGFFASRFLLLAEQEPEALESELVQFVQLLIRGISV